MEAPHLIDTLVARIAEQRPMHGKFLHNSVALLSPEEREEASEYIRHLLDEHDLSFLIECYLTILDDTFAAQADFFRDGRYRHSSFASVANDVYFDSAYMTRYMVGLALSTFIWPNHTHIHRFFKKTFPWNSGGRYLEIGPGHGFFLMQVMREAALNEFVGVDLSAASLELTRRVIDKLAPAKRSSLQLVHGDFLDATTLAGPFDVIVMGEVLEHVERPLAFLERIAALSAPGGYVFLTTCVNAPAIDHIYLYRNEREVADMISQAGLTIKESLAVPHAGKTLEQCVKQALPINVAYAVGR